MSSLSAGLSAYNAAEPKPMSSASIRSRQSQQRSYAGPPPPRNGGNSVADSYRQPRSVNGRSAQSVASALSHGSAGRSRRDADLDDDDDRSNNTERLVGLVNELTSGGSEDERRRQMQMDDERYHRSQIDNSFDSRSRMSGRNSRNSRQSMDPDADRSVRSGMPPPPPKSVRSGSSRRFDPDGMSHEFGADDPDGRHYAPSTNPRQQPVRGPPSVHSRSIMDDQSNIGPSVASSRQSRSYYDDGTAQEEESYYSHDSRQSTMMSAPPPRLSAEASHFSNGDEESYYSRDSRGSRTYQSSKKVRNTQTDTSCAPCMRTCKFYYFCNFFLIKRLTPICNQSFDFRPGQCQSRKQTKTNAPCGGTTSHDASHCPSQTGASRKKTPRPDRHGVRRLPFASAFSLRVPSSWASSDSCQSCSVRKERCTPCKMSRSV